MDLLILPILIVLGIVVLNGRDQRRRVALLGEYLSRHQIESLIQKLMQGYFRALGEADPERQMQIWNLLNSSEIALCEQFNAFVLEFSKLSKANANGSRLAFGFPYAVKLFPARVFDMRKVMDVHARALTNAMHNESQRSPKQRAFTMLAELLLMQHTCHWFCRSKTVASARLLAHHQTSYAQVVASVAADTRRSYLAIMEPK